MNSRKLIITGIILLMPFMTALGQSPSKFKLLIHSGVSFASYPKSDFSTFYNPALNYGAGLSYQLSSKMFLILDFNHYRFVPAEKWSWYMYFGDILVKLNKPFYMGDFVYDFNDLILSLKIKPLQTRISPYLTLGGGASYRRHANRWYIGVNGRKVFFSESIFYLVNAALGLEYQVNNRIDIFIEAGYNYCFFKNKKHNTGVTPIKIGLAWGL